MDNRYLEFDYRNFVNGGWRQNERWVSAPHVGLQDFHAAEEALFCPVCTKCGKNQRDGLCGDKLEQHTICWHPVGTAPVRAEDGGEGEDAVRTCPAHGSFNWRRAMVYSTMLLCPGNRWAKTAGGLSVYCAGVLGYRPWNGKLSLQHGNGRVHLIVCQTLSVSALLTIQKYVLQYIGWYLQAITTTSNTLSGWKVVRGPTQGDILKLASQDQHYRTVATVSPLEGSAYVQLFNDEPFKEDLRAAWGRGLLEGKTVWGWGREYLAMTFLEGSAQARVYCFNAIWAQAGNRGGTQKQIWARGGTMDENPANTPEDVRQTLETFPSWEREARRTGMMAILKGRILPDFTPEIHVWDDAQYDPLLMRGTKEPSEGAIFMACDPHDIRPWVMVWVLIEEGGLWRVVREWPTGAFRDMRHYSYAEENFGGHFQDYAAVIERMEATLPGGKNRVIRRIMDPAFGDSEKAGSGQTVRKAMQEQGYYFETDFPRDVEPGHHLLRKLLRGSWEPPGQPDALHFPHLLVASQCSNVVWSFMNYVNDEHSNPAKSREKPAEAGKDHIDCLRYLATSRCDYVNWKTIGRNYEAAKARVAARRRITRW